MHCKPREMRIVSIEVADRYSSRNRIGNMDDNYNPEGWSYVNINESGEDRPTSSFTLAVKNKNLGKFPSVGETVTTDLFLRTAAEQAALN